MPPHLLRLFLRRAPDQLKQLVEFCAARNAEAARAQAHKLKGGLYAAGATRLAEDVESLRAALDTTDWLTLEPRLQAIRRELGSMLTQLEHQLKAGGA